MEYVILSSDAEWYFTHQFGTESLTYIGNNEWSAVYWYGSIPCKGIWRNYYNGPPPHAVGIRVEIQYEDDESPNAPVIEFFTTEAQESGAFEINRDGSWHSIEWTYTPLDENEFVSRIVISGDFGISYALSSSIKNISFVYADEVPNHNCVWTNTVNCVEEC